MRDCDLFNEKSSETKGGGYRDIFILLKAYVKVSAVSKLNKNDILPPAMLKPFAS